MRRGVKAVGCYCPPRTLESRDCDSDVRGGSERREIRRVWKIALSFLVVGHIALGAAPSDLFPLDGPPLITTLYQARSAGIQTSVTSVPIRIEGLVCWTATNGSTFAMLDSSGGAIVEIPDLNLRLHSGQRVRLTGHAAISVTPNVIRFGVDDGSRLHVGRHNLAIEILGESDLPVPRTIGIGQVLHGSEEGSWVSVEGRVAGTWRESDGLGMELRVDPYGLTVLVTGESDEWPDLKGSDVRLTGFCHAAFNSGGQKVPNRLLVPSSSLVEIIRAGANAEAGERRLLTTAAEVRQLKRGEAELAIPARVRGVVTSTDLRYGGFTIQDLTGGLYIEASDPVQIGEFVQIEGRSDAGLFAPMLIPGQIARLGAGRIPEPIRPTWDQLMNGSLDAQYVEIEGIVSSVTTDGLNLVTRGGVLKISLHYGLDPEQTTRIGNSLIQIRGVLIAVRNQITHQVRLGEIRIFNPAINVQNPAPADLFAAPYKMPAELLLFDPQAGLFQRIRMSGQIIHLHHDLCFMMSEGSGVRFVAKSPAGLQIGDTVEIAGYPQLGGASPLLREAAVRKTGRARLPEATRLPAGNLFLPEYDATRVVIKGILAGVRVLNTSDSRTTRLHTGPKGSGGAPAMERTGAQSSSREGSDHQKDVAEETLLDIQHGNQNFVARVKGRNPTLASLPAGCRLELTGVYAAQVVNPPPERHVGAFELLLDSGANVKVLARPPWWTLRRLVITLGTLAGVLVLAMLWITELHRKVEQRTVQLEEQVQKRKTIEQHRTMEQERARVAQDLHDELGSGLTEISMLAAIPADGGSHPHLNQIADRARHMVTALDEIVWAMNPRHDSLESLGSYVCLYADRFLKLANITCRLKGSLDLPSHPVNPVHRHELFLAFKEALTNVVRHSGATEVRLNVRKIGTSLRLSLADNGNGLPNERFAPGMDGLKSMQARLTRVGGRFALTTKSGRGTTIRFYLPLN